MPLTSHTFVLIAGRVGSIVNLPTRVPAKSDAEDVVVAGVCLKTGWIDRMNHFERRQVRDTHPLLQCRRFQLPVLFISCMLP